MGEGTGPATTNSLSGDRARYVDRFGWLLALLAATTVLLFLVDLDAIPADTRRWTTVVVTVVVSMTLSLALRASGTGRRWQRVVDTVLTLGVAVTVAVALLASSTDVTGVAAPVALVVLAAISPAVVVRRLLRHRQVTRATLLGAISAYLLIAVAFFYAFLAVEQYQQAAFFGQPEPTTSFMYFSLTTITTLGYGDLAAHTEIGRLLATAEAVVGQVYLVTFVAMVVALLAQGWSDRPGQGRT